MRVNWDVTSLQTANDVQIYEPDLYDRMQTM